MDTDDRAYDHGVVGGRGVDVSVVSIGGVG